VTAMRTKMELGFADGDGDGGDGEGGAGSDRKLGSGLGGGLGGVGVATERNRKESKPADDQSSRDCQHVGASTGGARPCSVRSLRYARRRGVMWMPSAAAPAHAALA